VSFGGALEDAEPRYGIFGTGEGLGSGTENLGGGPGTGGGEFANSALPKEPAGVRKTEDVGEPVGSGKSGSAGEPGGAGAGGSLSTILFASSVESLSGETRDVAVSCNFSAVFSRLSDISRISPMTFDQAGGGGGNQFAWMHNS
jgi:hypothetical protein